MGNCLRSLGLQLLVTSWTLCSHQTELQRTLNGLSSRAQEPKGRRRLSVAESMRPRKDWMALLPALTWRISSSVAFGSPSQRQCLHYLQQCCNPLEWLSPPHQWGSGFPGKKKSFLFKFLHRSIPNNLLSWSQPQAAVSTWVQAHPNQQLCQRPQ